MSYDRDKILSLAKNTALQAGTYLRNHFHEKPKVEYKGDINLITERDRESQNMIVSNIKKVFPNHSILAEENLDLKKDEELLWLVDPLDGTTNYAHTLPVFCVSIAFLKDKKVELGVVYNPMMDEMFWACRGKGAFLNNNQIKVSSETKIDNSLLATGFPYDLRESCENNLSYFEKFIFRSRGIRRWGSAAIDLSYTAAGRFDGFWELKLFPWDTAAASLFIEETGGIITDFSGNPFDPFSNECLASNGKIHQQMLDIIKESKIVS